MRIPLMNSARKTEQAYFSDRNVHIKDVVTIKLIYIKIHLR